MNLKAAGILAAAGAGALLYGAIFEVDRLRLERRDLALPLWPQRLDGLRVGLLADLHVNGPRSMRLARRAASLLMAEEPDALLIAGDLLGFWSERSLELLACALEPLSRADIPMFAVPGNHDYWLGDPAWLEPLLADLGVSLLRNRSVAALGVRWVGVDSFNERRHDLQAAFSADDGTLPRVALWHEPDCVGLLPEGVALMVSGHTHGGQFITPWGWAPVRTRNGRRYVRGFFPTAPTPLYVSRGVGTTGPPSRLFCPPEATVLTLRAS